MNENGNYEVKRVNRTLLVSWLVIIGILLFAYSIEVVKHERTLMYLGEFALTMLVPFIIVFCMYHRNREWEHLGYAVVVGYSFMYAFVMFTGATQMVSSYILPLLCFLVLYHRPNLIVFSFLITLIVNIASLFYQMGQKTITVSNSKDIEIRFAVILVSFAGGFVSARLYNLIHNDNRRYMAELTEKNQEIQDMAIQTIATIANTIDAKDEYTRGHSKRVAEYSVAIARELGLSQEGINNLRSIALLHDIGKIGVPDSVLNKPGKLTNDEYELMKQHTVMGSEILKDIKTFQGIDIGARSHHERYDGTGYPDQIAGTEIPYIARIIAVADAFDAMTSNRVYRKQLELEYVIEELKRCSGTQFDPNIAEVLIRMLEEKRLTPSTIEKDNSENMSELSMIWERVMQKDEEKYRGQSLSDELTGLYSRSYGESLITTAIESNKGALIILDVDSFRKINGEEGFILGDIILRSLARCLENIEYDKILARYGGDEFVAFLPDITQRESIIAILDKLYNDVKMQRTLINDPINFTISAGIVVCNEMKNVYQDCFLDADRALYMSKRNGGNCYTFYEKDNNDRGGISANADLLRLKDFVMHPDVKEQYQEIISPEINNAVDLVNELIEKNEVPLQVILFTVKSSESTNVSLEKQREVMGYLETAISRSIKGRDFTLKFSSTQRMILLTKSQDDGARAVSTHVMKEFYKLYSDNEINVSFDTIELR